MKFFNNWSLRTKLLSVLGLVILMLGVSSLLGMGMIKQAYEKDTILAFEAKTGALDSGIQAQFFERYGDVQAFAVNPNVKSLDAKKITADLDAYVKLYGIYDVVMVVDKDGKYVASNTKDASGKTVNTEELRKYQYHETAWFKSSLSGTTTDDKENNYSGTFFEEFHLDPLMQLAFSEEKIGLSFSAPIKNAEGQLVGVITNRSNSSWIDNEVKSVHKSAVELAGSSSMNIMLVNGQGQIVNLYAPEESKKTEVEYLVEKGQFHQSLKDKLPTVVEKMATDKSKYGGGFEPDPRDGGLIAVAYETMGGSKWVSSLDWKIIIYDHAENVTAAADHAMMVFYMTFGVGILMSMALAFWFALSLSKKISGITEVLKSNSGDLSEASSKVASSSTELSEGSTQQAAALQETVAAVDEISAMVDKNAEAATKSKEASGLSRDAAMKGRQNVDQMIEAISEISRSNDDMSSQMDSSNQQLNEITKLITDIGNKTKVINEIVFQTKLLSFNASVEAARAGEYGKGFAVVAEEVGNLAQMSGNAAKEISTLLDESVNKVNSIVTESKSRVEQLMNLSRDKVKVGEETAKACNDSLEEILSQVSSVDTLVSEIAVASQEQSTGIREIAKAVGQMETVTQQNSSVAEASSVAAEQLNSQSIQLNQLVQDLRYIVAGDVQEESSESKKVVSMRKFKEKVSQAKPSKPESSMREQNLTSPEKAKKVSGDDYVPGSDDPGFQE